MITSCDLLGWFILIFITSAALYSVYLYILVNSHFEDRRESGLLIWSWLFDGSKLDEKGKKYRVRWLVVSLAIIIGIIIYFQLVKVLC